MCQTLFKIPHELNDIPVFGWGWALLLWSILGVVVILTASRHGSTKRSLVEWGPFLAIVGLMILYVLPAIELTSVDASGQPIKDGLAVRGYGVMLGLAILASLALALYRARARQIRQEVVLSLGTWLIVAGIAGGRLFYLIEYWEEYRHDNVLQMLGNALNFAQGGLVVYGAFIGGFVAGCVYVRRYKLSFSRFADLVAPSLMLGLAIGRIGCFCNGCCYGGSTDHPWGVRFPVESVPYAEHRSQGRLHGFQIDVQEDGAVLVCRLIPHGPAARAGLQSGDLILEINGVPIQDLPSADTQSWDVAQRRLSIAESVLSIAPPSISVRTPRGDFRWQVEPWPDHTEPIQPSQLYSAITAGLICLLLLAAEPFLTRPGYLFGMLITIYPPARFVLEWIRVDEASVAGTGLTIAQNISIVITVLALGFWFYQWRAHRGK